MTAVVSGGDVASGSFPAHAPRLNDHNKREQRGAARPGGHPPRTAPGVPPLEGADWATCLKTGVALAHRRTSGGDVIKGR